MRTPLILPLIIACLVAATQVEAQSPPPCPPAVISQNQVLISLQAVDQNLATETAARLGILVCPRPVKGLKAPGTSPHELAEIAANPAFDAAYKQHPDETLVLLRWLNRTISQ